MGWERCLDIFNHFRHQDIQAQRLPAQDKGVLVDVRTVQHITDEIGSPQELPVHALTQTKERFIVQLLAPLLQKLRRDVHHSHPVFQLVAQDTDQGLLGGEPRGISAGGWRLTDQPVDGRCHLFLFLEEEVS